MTLSDFVLMKKQIKILKNLEGVEANCDQFQNIPTIFSIPLLKDQKD